MLKMQQLFIEGSESILSTMKKLDETGQRILFVAPGGVLKGALTDGDIRKYLMNGGSLEDTAYQAANKSPRSLPVSQRSLAKARMAEMMIDALPLVESDGRIADIVFANGFDVVQSEEASFPVVINAGGLGTRLYPYTKILPKPLIPIGEQPICEMIMDRFSAVGSRQFYMIVNYKRNMIKSYFRDLEQKPYTVDFVDEDVPLGTGGGLCLLRGMINETFVFSNCDTLLDVDYAAIYNHHKAAGNVITMICANKTVTVPYGVVELNDEGGIGAMREKPTLQFLTNTGVYVVEPRIIEELEEGKKQGFPEVMERYRLAGEKVGVYAIEEDAWMDMGQLEELEKMRERLSNNI
ncbi:MAG: NTP transferase domain-containing protein [Oscillospiraceae bacterium]|nr:NTP transferase domain-containing protein [Oscillospiraceae bacterium]